MNKGKKPKLGDDFLFDKTDQLGVNTIRTLSIEAVQKRTQDILVYQWVLPQWRMHFGQNI